MHLILQFHGQRKIRETNQKRILAMHVSQDSPEDSWDASCDAMHSLSSLETIPEYVHRGEYVLIEYVINSSSSEMKLCVKLKSINLPSYYFSIFCRC